MEFEAATGVASVVTGAGCWLLHEVSSRANGMAISDLFMVMVMVGVGGWGPVKAGTDVSTRHDSIRPRILGGRWITCKPVRRV